MSVLYFFLNIFTLGIMAINTLKILDLKAPNNPPLQLNSLRTLATAAKSEDNARILHDNNIGDRALLFSRVFEADFTDP